MAYKIDKQSGDVIISGFEQGIADDPYAGISDIRNINLISIPKEASVNFSTSKITYPNPGTGTVSSASAGDDTITFANLSGIENGMAITFSATTVGGVSTNTVYWISNLDIGGSNTTAKLYTEASITTLVNISGTGTGTFTFVVMTGFPKYFTVDSANRYYTVDSTGRVWSDVYTTGTNFYWTYLGNTTLTNANGNGILAYTTYASATANNTYLFVWRNGLIDYTLIGAPIAWTYGWKPSDGTTGNTGSVLKTYAGTNNNHEALLAPDNKVYFTDTSWIGRFYQLTATTVFLPTNTGTYVYDQTQVLPTFDTANCMAVLGNNILVGGSKNVIYPWDTFSALPSYPILLAENNIQKMVTVNTNVYALVGNRGRVYQTNGSQAGLWKKIPDHISGTVEPYYTWGGLTSNKNQVYFSALVETNAGVANNNYGGLWAVDVDTKALRLTNKLSYGTYAGYATAIIPNFGTTPSGTGLFIGWNSGASTYGIDTTISTPYTGGEATIDSDLIPIGTFLKPNTNGRVEFKLAVPLVSGESIKLQYRQAFSDSFVDVSSSTTFATAGIYSGVYQSVPFQESQWIQLRAVLTSTASSPSYCRLTELRLGN